MDTGSGGLADGSKDGFLLRNSIIKMPQITLHTSTLFDPKQKKFLSNISITVCPESGLISKVLTRKEPLPKPLPGGHIDLRGKVVLPGFVDAHTHIFLHSYEYVC